MRRESNQTSIFTSFSFKKNKANDFTTKGNISKVSMDDLKKLEADGVIKIHTPDDVASMMKNNQKKKIKKDANNVKEIMTKNDEILIEGEIPSEFIQPAK